METGLLIVKENFEKGDPITLSHTTHDIITPKIVEYINAAHQIRAWTVSITIKYSNK